MSYRNFVDDFPKRCIELLDHYAADATKRSREVTLLLCAASAAITIPYARLTDAGRSAVSGPRQDDRALLGAARSTFDKARRSRLDEGQIWPVTGFENWRFGTISPKLIKKPPDQWIGQARSFAEAKWSCEDLLLVIRNALAHANVWDEPDWGTNSIKELVFQSFDDGKARFVVVAPGDFEAFLRQWVEFLAKLKMPGGPQNEVVQFAMLVVPAQAGTHLSSDLRSS